ncbi:MAG: hypothetical protein JRI23_19190 [Deltaproteobacteria bacterium]|jgi:hypothetical protein|nr:hypothetical protein [Deltaproteobacteria bacterium]MBW2533991.1 hypothetical protein [Deltaproteobacteria bacterium]
MSRELTPKRPEIDWTGVAPDTAPIEPLTAATFVARLDALTEGLAAIEQLRRAFDEQHGGCHR